MLFKFGGVISWENLQEVTGDNHFMVVIKCSLYYVKIQNNESLFFVQAVIQGLEIMTGIIDGWNTHLMQEG